MQIVIDENIPYIRNVFEPYVADVKYMGATSIDNQSIKDADALIVRTRTLCNQSLLEGSKIKIIASATIGFDHIDIDYCRNHNIQVTTAQGCNSQSVAQWVFAAIRELYCKKRDGNKSHNTIINKPILGIIGVGNVGGAVNKLAQTYNINTLLCDPPKAKLLRTNSLYNKDHTIDINIFLELSTMLPQCDIVTLHVPLNDTTHTMVDNNFLSLLKPTATLLNSSRGELIDEPSLINHIHSTKSFRTALDVWCDEPIINQELLNATTIATPHIAGYSMRGKIQGTQIVVRAIAQFLDLKQLKQWSYPLYDTIRLEHPDDYNIISDDYNLRSTPNHFELLRTNYKYR